MLLVSIPFLIFLPQSQDALLALVSDGRSIWLRIIFAVVCLLWALETFYWAQFMSRRFPPELPPERESAAPLLSNDALKRLNEEFPKWVGMLAIAAVFVATVKANWGNNELDPENETGG